MDSPDKKPGTRRGWERETLDPHIEKHPERDVEYSTVSSLPIERLYAPEDLEGLDFEKEIGWPGRYPYTRGIQPTMYRGRLWTMRMFAGMGTAEDTNARFKFLLKQGQTGLSTAFDLPTLMGRDSDNPLSEGEVGREGVAVASLRDMEILFDKIPLEQVSTSMTINAPAAVVYAMYLAVAEKQGVPFQKLRGTIQNDILKEYIAQKEWIYPPEPSVKLIVDTMEYSKDFVPQWNTISISGYHIREAGSTAVQELAFTLADGVHYVKAGIERGMDVDDFAPRLSFFFNSHNDFFEEVAKLRAARRLWAKLLRERYGAKNEKSWKLRTHVQTAGCSLTAQQPLNNVVRVAIQALAAVLGGTQSLHTDSMDETLGLPTEKAATVALRTQQIIAEESGVINTIDPLAGSYFVESLTSEMERRALAYIDKIEDMGGMIKAVEAGFPQREIAEASYVYQRQLEENRKVIVGVNKYVADEEEPPFDVLKIPPETEEKQLKRLAEVKRTRDSKAVLSALRNLTAKAKTGDNLMPAILDCVREYCTLEETGNAMKEVFGEYRETSVI
ncbi:MAG: methylmalonyl-CoA mutase family protein [Acidobacteriota bacterium]|jgi:methylmalonyl-CoA mutase, N-terminal domain